MKPHTNALRNRDWTFYLLLILGAAALPQQSSALPFLAWYAQDVAIRQASATTPPTLTPTQELALTAANNAAYLSEAVIKPIGFVGLTVIDGSDAPYVLTSAGENLALSFQFIDPATGLPTSGPAVASVVYEANLDPFTPNVLVPIGTSSNSLSNFAISWSSSGFEPMIEAIPYDASDNPIEDPGVDGDNSAVGLNIAPNAPDSASTFYLLGLGIAGLWTIRRFNRVGSA